MIKDKRKKVAIIYEGEKTEENLFKSIGSHFFEKCADILIVTLPAAANLYMLWAKLQEDNFETDVVSVLKEMNSDISKRLEGAQTEDFSEIYLFFDYDGHQDNIPKKFAGKDVLKEMLITFDNETELGKLYISYPMVEAIKEISTKKQDYKTFYLPLEECAVYKEAVGGASDYGDFRHITKSMWHIACNASRKRASVIVSYKEEGDYRNFIENMSQEKIYDAQKDKFIHKNRTIGILSSIPLFLIEYYDESFWEMIQDLPDSNTLNFVMASTERGENADQYVRELRDNDRF